MHSISPRTPQLAQKITECSELIDRLGTVKIFALVAETLRHDLSADPDEQVLADAEVLCVSDAFLAPELVLAFFLGLAAMSKQQHATLQFPVTPERLQRIADLDSSSGEGEVAPLLAFRDRRHAL